MTITPKLYYASTYTAVRPIVLRTKTAVPNKTTKIIKHNCLKFPFVVKATALNSEYTNFVHIYGMPLTDASFVL